MVKTSQYDGIHAVLYALFNRDETIDHGAMAAQVGFCVENGCHGITVLGLATEVLKLTFAERRSLVETTSRALAGRRPFSVTIPGNSVAEQTELARIARDNGADWLILQPPMVGTYDAGVYLSFFERVAGSADLPVAIQNAPQYLGRALSGDDLSQLSSRCANLAAVKSEDDPEGILAVIDAAGDDLHILGGRGGLDLIATMQAGCTGLVLAPDIAPVAVRIWQDWTTGKQESAAKLYELALPAIQYSMRSLEHLSGYGKRIFAAQAGLEIYDRAPCLATTAAERDASAKFGAALRSAYRV